MSNLSVFGSTGYIGNTFCELFPDRIVKIPREDRNFDSKDVLYFISTTTNQNVFKDLHVDIDTNLSLFVDVLSTVTALAPISVTLVPAIKFELTTMSLTATPTVDIPVMIVLVIPIAPLDDVVTIPAALVNLLEKASAIFP